MWSKIQNSMKFISKLIRVIPFLLHNLRIGIYQKWVGRLKNSVYYRVLKGWVKSINECLSHHNINHKCQIPFDLNFQKSIRNFKELSKNYATFILILHLKVYQDNLK